MGRTSLQNGLPSVLDDRITSSGTRESVVASAQWANLRSARLGEAFSVLLSGVSDHQGGSWEGEGRLDGPRQENTHRDLPASKRSDPRIKPR